MNLGEEYAAMASPRDRKMHNSGSVGSAIRQTDISRVHMAFEAAGALARRLEALNDGLFGSTPEDANEKCRPTVDGAIPRLGEHAAEVERRLRACHGLIERLEREFISEGNLI